MASLRSASCVKRKPTQFTYQLIPLSDLCAILFSVEKINQHLFLLLQLCNKLQLSSSLYSFAAQLCKLQLHHFSHFRIFLTSSKSTTTFQRSFPLPHSFLVTNSHPPTTFPTPPFLLRFYFPCRIGSQDFPPSPSRIVDLNLF